MENIELYILILIAILGVVDGQSIARRILLLLATLTGGDNNGPEAKKVQDTAK